MWAGRGVPMSGMTLLENKGAPGPAPMPSTQEMFDRAYRGLHSQGFRRCVSGSGQCLYAAPSSDGAGPETWHCAWGWVDPTVLGRRGSVTDLAHDLIGLAGRLDPPGLRFAIGLQRAHDSGYTPDGMRRNLEWVAERHFLVLPSFPEGPG